MTCQPIWAKAFFLFLLAAAPDVSVSETFEKHSLDLSYSLSDGINRIRLDGEAIEETTDCAGNVYQNIISHQILILTGPKEETALQIKEFIEKLKDEMDSEGQIAL